MCNDITNVEECNYDNGECCVELVRRSCFVCICQEDGVRHVEDRKNIDNKRDYYFGERFASIMI